MDGVNKVLTAILGLVVVMILFAVISSRLKFGNTGILSFKKAGTLTPVPTNTQGKVTPTRAPKKGFFSFLSQPKITPTPRHDSITPNPTKGQSKGGALSFTEKSKPNTSSTPEAVRTPSRAPSQVVRVQTIPKTGPELLFPIAATSFLAGIYLRKRS